MIVSTEDDVRFQQSDATLNLLQSLETQIEDTNPSMWHTRFMNWLKTNKKCPKIDLAKICTTRKSLNCNATEQFQSVDGRCNNVRQPFQGSAFSSYSRLLPATYDDGIFNTRKSKSGQDLPNPRSIGSQIMADINNFTGGVNLTRIPNLAAIIFSQVIIHDVASHVMKQHGKSILGIQCCSSDRQRILPQEVLSKACDPIVIPNDDEFYSDFNIKCNNFVRSQTVLSDDCGLKAGDQVNGVTNYIDGSFIYGSSVTQMKELRSFVNGLMKMDDSVLPFVDGFFVAGREILFLYNLEKFQG